MELNNNSTIKQAYVKSYSCAITLQPVENEIFPLEIFSVFGGLVTVWCHM